MAARLFPLYLWASLLTSAASSAAFAQQTIIPPVGIVPTSSGNYTIANGGTAQIALPAGAIRNGFLIKNPTTATEVGCFSITGAASTTVGGGVNCLATGESYTFLGGVTSALSIDAATTGHVFTIWYW